MQPDLSNAGIVKYGFNRRLPTYGIHEPLHKDRASFQRTTTHQAPDAEARGYTLELSFFGTAAAFFVCGLCSAGTAIRTAAAPIRNSVSFNLPRSSASASQSSPRREEQGRNTILELRPAHRTLAEKAREEMSEFDRDYPW